MLKMGTKNFNEMSKRWRDKKLRKALRIAAETEVGEYYKKEFKKVRRWKMWFYEMLALTVCMAGVTVFLLLKIYL
jgi:hypothetical protein